MRRKVVGLYVIGAQDGRACASDTTGLENL